MDPFDLLPEVIKHVHGFLMSSVANSRDEMSDFKETRYACQRRNYDRHCNLKVTFFCLGFASLDILFLSERTESWNA